MGGSATAAWRASRCGWPRKSYADRSWSSCPAFTSHRSWDSVPSKRKASRSTLSGGKGQPRSAIGPEVPKKVSSAPLTSASRTLTAALREHAIRSPRPPREVTAGPHRSQAVDDFRQGFHLVFSRNSWLLRCCCCLGFANQAALARHPHHECRGSPRGGASRRRCRRIQSRSNCTIQLRGIAGPYRGPLLRHQGASLSHRILVAPEGICEVSVAKEPALLPPLPGSLPGHLTQRRVCTLGRRGRRERLCSIHTQVTGHDCQREPHRPKLEPNANMISLTAAPHSTKGLLLNTSKARGPG